MRRKWLFAAVPIGIVVFTIIGGEVVMHLWNWLLPALFDWRMISFWQAIGLLALCRILFGGLRLGGSAHSHARRRMEERWEKMTPDERDHFRHWMHCRKDNPPSADPKTGA